MKDEVHRIETSREELLDQSLFSSLDDVRGAIYWWMCEYNEELPMRHWEVERPARFINLPETLLWNCRLDGKFTPCLNLL